MFKVVKNAAWLDWFPVDRATTLYVGQLVAYTLGDGLTVRGVASGTPESDAFPFGVVIGFNDQTPTYSSTYKNNYGTGVATQALLAARKSTGCEGMVGKNDTRLMAQIAVIDEHTILKGSIFNATYGVAPTVVTCTTGSSDGLASMVHGNVDITSQVAYNNTYYGRSGLNRGIYRTSYATSRTTPTFYTPWPQDWTVGDTFVNVSVGLGRTGIQTDAQNMFIDNAGALTSYFGVDVYSLDLEVAGKETATFRFVNI
jgi:hypothetical protein